MLSLPDFANKNVFVFGLGRAGSSAAKLLAESGANVFAWDDNTESRERLKSEINQIQITEINNADWSNIESLILSPGVPLTHPMPHEVVNLAKDNNCEIICDVELLYRANSQAKFIGITGTNGKSTTTALIGHVLSECGLKVQVGGNIGVPASSLEDLGLDTIYVIEMSSYQLDLVLETKFDIALLLNITPDHIDRHGSMDGYVNSKKKIFNNMGSEDVAVIATDDEYTRNIYSDLSDVSKTAVSGYHDSSEGVYVLNDILYDYGTSYDLGSLKYLPGQHNAQNIAAAYAVAQAAGLKADEIINAIKSFEGLVHRMEFVREVSGVKFVNDSKATNAVAAEKALLSYDNIFWIVGGVPKEGGIEPLSPLFGKVTKAFLVGESSSDFAKTLKDTECIICGDLQTALPQAFEEAKKVADSSPVVLLSPACASFDQYGSFEERGNAFKNLVSNLE